jgi:hypothetical protein
MNLSVGDGGTVSRSANFVRRANTIYSHLQLHARACPRREPPLNSTSAASDGTHHPSFTPLKAVPGHSSELSFACSASGLTISDLAELARRNHAQTVALLAAVLSEHQLVVIDDDCGQFATMADLRVIHVAANQALGYTAQPPARSGGAHAVSRDNLRGQSFDSHPESGVFGFCEHVDWAGLRGSVRPTARWEMDRPNWHHDMQIGPSVPTPPAVLSFYCREVPSQGSGFLRYHDGSPMPYSPGSTLFRTTRRGLAGLQPAVATRARVMVGLYSGVAYSIIAHRQTTEQAFSDSVAGRELASASAALSQERYPVMTSDGSVPSMPPSMKEIAQATAHTSPISHQRVDHSRVSLVQRDPTTGDEYVLVNGIQLDGLEEHGQKLGWQESMDFVRAVLAPLTRQSTAFAHTWKSNQLVIWDNRTVQHSGGSGHKLFSRAFLTRAFSNFQHFFLNRNMYFSRDGWSA